jgi:hypothetical protein
MVIVINDQRKMIRISVQANYKYRAINTLEFSQLEQGRNSFNISQEKFDKMLSFTEEVSDMINLSLGGVALSLHEPLKVDDQFILEIQVDNYPEKIRVVCSILQCDKEQEAAESSTMPTYKVRAHFEFFIGQDKQILERILEKEFEKTLPH